jgi:hypothetical protein
LRVKNPHKDSLFIFYLKAKHKNKFVVIVEFIKLNENGCSPIVVLCG